MILHNYKTNYSFTHENCSMLGSVPGQSTEDDDSVTLCWVDSSFKQLCQLHYPAPPMFWVTNGIVMKGP